MYRLSCGSALGFTFYQRTERQKKNSSCKPPTVVSALKYWEAEVRFKQQENGSAFVRLVGWTSIRDLYRSADDEEGISLPKSVTTGRNCIKTLMKKATNDMISSSKQTWI